MINLKCENPYINKIGESYGCGQCQACKKRYVIEWSIRCRHEDILTDKKMFITLTYDSKNIVKTAYKKQVKGDVKGTLVEKHMQDFIKRLRRRADWKGLEKFKYIYCGEYGDLKFRPHYHMIIWGVNQNDFDKKLLTEVWGKGNVDISEKEISDNAYQYILGYVRKKIPNRDGGFYMYEGNGREKPYMRVSKGIGKEYLKKNIKKIADDMFIVYRGMVQSVPRYYIKLIKQSESLIVNTIYQYKDIKEYKIVNKKIYIENPNGELTKKITEKLNVQTYTKVKEYKEELKNILSKEEIKNLINNKISNIIKRNSYKLERYEYINNMKEEERSLYLAKFINKNVKRLYKKVPEKQKSSNKKRKLHTTYKGNLLTAFIKMNKIAIEKNQFIKNTIYNKRDVYELNEILTA